MNMYIGQTETGVRKTQKGVNFSKGTVKSIRLVGKLMTEFQQKVGRVYDFDDVDYEFRAKFLDFLYNHKRYNVNTAAKCLNILITVMAASEAEGYHNNRKCLGPQFRARRREVDAIYLTREELKAMMLADLSHLSPVHEVARDIFMVGVFTAQRVSDYNNIGMSNILFGEDGNLTINIRQQKTGAIVSIPVREELNEILRKYDYNLPHISERIINRCIKEVGKVAGVCAPVTVETTAGGVIGLDTRPKYELIQTHTARRTGATLMYLAGMDVFNICSVTGHSSVSMLKKYIKADEIDRARTIRRDPAFARW
jgi:integrase